jgi:hypothetical protein
VLYVTLDSNNDRRVYGRAVHVVDPRVRTRRATFRDQPPSTVGEARKHGS